MFHKIQSLPLIENRSLFLLDAAKDKKVLHLGCVDTGFTEKRIETDQLLHSKLEKVTLHLTGVDSNNEGLEQLKKLGFSDLVLADIEEKLPISSKYDVIIAGEIVEHLSNPGKFLYHIGELMTKNGSLIVTVPNAYCLTNFIRVLFNNIETVHEDHVCYYSYVTMRALLKRFGFEVTEQYGYSDLGRVNGIKLFFKKCLHKVMMQHRSALGEGLLFVCKKSE